MSEDKINRLNMIEQNLRSFVQQKQNLQAQILEQESALEELNDSDSYKLVGNILIKKDPKKLREEIEKDKNNYVQSVKALEEQESKLREKAESLRKELIQEMKK